MVNTQQISFNVYSQNSNLCYSKTSSENEKSPKTLKSQNVTHTIIVWRSHPRVRVTAYFRFLLAYKSAVQKPKHCRTWDFSLPLVTYHSHSGCQRSVSVWRILQLGARHEAEGVGRPVDLPRPVGRVAPDGLRRVAGKRRGRVAAPLEVIG